MTNEKSTAKTKDEMRWAMVHAEEARVLALVESLPNNFAGAWQVVLQALDLSQAQLAADAQLPEATVSEIIGEKRRGRLHNVMRMCIAARLPWDVSAFLLNQGGLLFAVEKQDACLVSVCVEKLCGVVAGRGADFS